MNSDDTFLTTRQTIRFIMKELNLSLPQAVKIFRWALRTGFIKPEVLQ